MWFGMKLLARVSAYKKLMLSGILYLASTALILFGGNVYVLYLAFFINGISYGVHLPSRRQYINETAPENMLNRLHGLGDMAYNNIGGLAGNQISGMLADNLGVRFMVGFSWAFQGIAFAIMSCFKRFQKKGIDSAA
jgi:MFS family permease